MNEVLLVGGMAIVTFLIRYPVLALLGSLDTMAVNYGIGRVRFIMPVRSGKRVRGRFVLDSVEEKAPGQLLVGHKVTVEIEGEEKPALVADWLGLIFV